MIAPLLKRRMELWMNECERVRDDAQVSKVCEIATTTVVLHGTKKILSERFNKKMYCL